MFTRRAMSAVPHPALRHPQVAPVLALLALLATPCAWAASPAASPASAKPAHPESPYTVIPLKRGQFRGELLATVRINGKPCELLLDTGCNTSNLFDEALPKLGLTAADSDMTLSGVGGAEKLRVAAFDTLAVSGFPAKGPGKIGVRSRAHAGCDGILGTDLLAGSHALIDLRAAALLLPKPGATHASPPGAVAVPLRRFHGLPTFAVTLNGVPARLLLDTGGQQTMLDAALVKKAGLKTYDTDSEAVGTGGASARLRLVIPEALDLSGYKLVRPPCLVADLGHIAANGIDGMLSAEVLAAVGARIDIDGARVLLETAPADLRDTGVIPGDLPADVAPAKLLAGNALVFSGLLASPPKLAPSAAGARDATVTLAYRVREVIRDVSGKHKPGDTVPVSFTLPAGPDLHARLHAEVTRHAAAIVMLGDGSGAPAPLASTLLRGSPVRVEQLRAAAESPRKD